MGAFLGMLSETSMNIALPDLCVAFGVTTGTAQWMVVGYMLAIGIVLPCVGFLLKWIDTRRLLMGALVLFLVGSLISASASMFVVLLLGRMLQGVGTGIILPTLYASMIHVFRPMELGAANGVAGLVIMFAPVIGPTISGVMIGAFSWRSIFVLFAVIAFLALVLARVFFRSPIEITRPRIDWPSVAGSIVGFGSLVAGIGFIPDMGLSPTVLALLVVGVGVLTFYIRRQLHVDNPVLDLKPLFLSGFRTPAIMVTLSFSCTLAFMYVAPQELQRGMGLGPSTAGMLMLAGGVTNAVFSFIAGRLYDRTGARRLVRLGAAFSVVSSILFIGIGTNSNPAFFVLAHVLLMIGIPLMQQAAQSDALANLPRELASDGSTILNTMQQVSGAIATAVVTLLLSSGYSDQLDVAQGFVNGSRYGYAFALLLIVLVAALSVVMRISVPDMDIDVVRENAEND